ncbi:hypothetical protein HZ326_22706 [Fusarium oxysporum f. sp. albedinis]|nr:hypothetical protein HZ326_22706 [Fusarium oxysporum f. sp. albedinis]
MALRQPSSIPPLTTKKKLGKFDDYGDDYYGKDNLTRIPAEGHVRALATAHMLICDYLDVDIDDKALKDRLLCGFVSTDDFLITTDARPSTWSASGVTPPPPLLLLHTTHRHTHNASLIPLIAALSPQLSLL